MTQERGGDARRQETGENKNIMCPQYGHQYHLCILLLIEGGQ